MNRYYYTVASLPMLFYEEDLSLSIPTLLEMSVIDLADEDYRLIENAGMRDLDGGDPTCQALEAWRAWEGTLRNELVKVRAQTKGYEAEKYVREGPEAFGVERVAREAAGDSSPLAGEDTLNRARWAFLDDLETGHHFDMEKLVVYFLKLQLLERKALFNTEKGTEKFEELIGNLSNGQAA